MFGVYLPKGLLIEGTEMPFEKTLFFLAVKKTPDIKYLHGINYCWLVEEAHKTGQHAGESWYVSSFRKIKQSSSLLNDLSFHRSRPSKNLEIPNSRKCMEHQGFCNSWRMSYSLKLMFLWYFYDTFPFMILFFLKGVFIDSKQVAVLLQNVCMHPLLPYPST